MQNKATDAIKSLADAGQNAFVTVKSSPQSRPSVMLEFPTLAEAHEFHWALIECGLIARNIKLKEKQLASR